MCVKIEKLTQLFVKLLNEQYATRDFNIYIDEQQHQLIQAAEQEMSDDLVAFNKDKIAKINELNDKITEFNYFQTLRTINANDLLDKTIFKKINNALLQIYLASVDYKPPVKKQKTLPPEQPVSEEQVKAETTENPEHKDQGEDQKSEAEEPKSEAEEQKPEAEEQKPEGEEQKNEAEELKASMTKEGDIKPEIVNEEPEEEFIMPPISLFEEAMVQAKKHLKLNVIQDERFGDDIIAIVRFRIPLNRPVDNPEAPEEKTEPVAAEDVVEKEPEVKEKDEFSMPNLVGITQDERNEIFNQLILNNDFIEPFNGTSFEREKQTLTGINIIYS